MIDASPLLADLNTAQRAAVTAPPGPLLIIAGAGSGKTRTLTHRIAWRIAHGERASHVLAITFTNKAAGELRHRIGALVGAEADAITVGTFHATGLRMLRERGEAVGLARGFAVADDADATALMKRVLKTRGVKPDRLAHGDARNWISGEKSELRGPDDAVVPPRIAEHTDLLRAVYRDYDDALRASNLADFDDLLALAVRLLRESSDARTHYRDRWRHLFVDEYQDTNTAQYSLVRLLAEGRDDLTVVGDDYQAIYGWRNADYRNILNFKRDWPIALAVSLEENYRSTQPILDAADAVIRKVASRSEKRLVAVRGDGDPVVIYEARDEQDEARWVTSRVKTLIAAGTRPSEIAVLYRTNAQSRPFEELFVQGRVTYRIIGGVRFYERREVKDILAYLRVIMNPNDASCLERIANVPARGIGAVGMGKILAHGLDAVAATSRPAAELRDLLVRLREAQPTQPLGAFLRTLLRETDYKSFLREAYDPSRTGRDGTFEDRWENVEELIGVAERYDTLSPAEAAERFLEDVALFSHADAMDARAEAVNLMTAHLAKGLEFDAVFVVGAEEGLLPHARSIGDQEALDEERRLAYVALTRGRNRVHVSFARVRTLHGDRARRLPSRFLADIPERLIAYEGSPLADPELIEEWEDDW